MTYALALAGPFAVEQYGDDAHAEYHVWFRTINGATGPLLKTKSLNDLYVYLEDYHKEFSVFLDIVKEKLLASDLKDELFRVDEDNFKL
jgi:hypothetical protein